MRLNALSSVQRLLLSAAAAATLTLASTPASAQDIPNAGRLGFVSGNVSIEPAGIDTWGQAYPNLPVGPGDRVVTDATGRAEIQVGQTFVRVGPNSDVTLQNENPLSIAFALAAGTVHVHILGLWPEQAMQVHTVNGNITTLGASEFRVEAFPDQDSSVYTSFGPPVGVTAPGFSEKIASGQSLEMSGWEPPYPQWLQPAAPDDLDNWSMMRDRQFVNAVSYRYVSPYIPGAGELDGYGDWQPGTDYGAVWFPRNVPAGWAPYRYGHWVNHAPWGWMWVEDEPWGYAPFHYGRWVAVGGRWGWIPGPPAARPVFAPALVVFAGGIQFGGVGVSVWFPLGPGEPYRPPYPCPPEYIDRVNIANITETNVIHVQKTYVNIVNVTNVTNITYVNRTVGVTAMNHNDFASGRTAAQVSVKVDPQQLQHVTVLEKPEPKPTAASYNPRPPAHPVAVKAERPVLVHVDAKQQAGKPGGLVTAPKALPGRTAVAPPPGSKVPPPAPAKSPVAAPPAHSAAPAPEPKPEARPVTPPPAKAAPAEATHPKQEAKPGTPPPQHTAPAPAAEPKPAAKPETAPPGAKPDDKTKLEDKTKPEDKKTKTKPPVKPEDKEKKTDPEQKPQ